jgi:hypothetical protein
MKHKLTRLLCVLIGLLCLTCAASAAETYPTIEDLYQHWAMTQTPDWVCSVSSTDGSSRNMTVVVNSQAAAEELTAMVEDPSTMAILVADGAYTHNELLEVQDAITGEHMGPAGPVVSIGTGWAVIDGEVRGFGESGRESRVVVGVLPEHVEEYRKLLKKQYGDMVYVESSGPIVTYEDTMEVSREELAIAPPPFAPWVFLGAVALLLTAVILFRLKENKM